MSSVWRTSSQFAASRGPDHRPDAQSCYSRSSCGVRAASLLNSQALSGCILLCRSTKISSWSFNMSEQDCSRPHRPARTVSHWSSRPTGLWYARRQTALTSISSSSSNISCWGKSVSSTRTLRQRPSCKPMRRLLV